MENFCPECMGVLSPDGDGKLRCATHGGQYRILFQRHPPEPPRVSVPVTPPADEPATAGVPPPLPTVARGVAGKFCVQHPAIPATQQCQACGAFMCDTCDFILPGGLHFCPACATKPQTELSPKRKTLRAWSLGLAGLSTLGMVGLFAGAFAGMARSREGVAALGVLLMFLILFPAVVGLSLGLGATDRRLANPMSLRIAVIWNSVVVGVFLLLSLIGNLR